MPAIWRPNVSGALPDVDVEVGVTEHASSKGTKRKRAPPTKGPCEHGVKPRSKCKVCGACPHGKWRSKCKEHGGQRSICEHGRQRSCTVVRLSARSAVGLGICDSASTVVGARSSLQGVRWGSNLRARSYPLYTARSAVGLKSASTVVSALRARSAVGLKSASTVVSADTARSAVGLKSASTVVSADTARSAVGLKSASTVVSALSARSAVGLKSASTVVYALSARSAVGAQSARTVVYALSARSVAPRINESRDESVGRYSTQHSTQRRQQTSDRGRYRLHRERDSETQNRSTPSPPFPSQTPRTRTPSSPSRRRRTGTPRPWPAPAAST